MAMPKLAKVVLLVTPEACYELVQHLEQQCVQTVELSYDRASRDGSMVELTVSPYFLHSLAPELLNLLGMCDCV